MESALYSITLFSSLYAGISGTPRKPRPFPYCTVIVCSILIACLVAQIVAPTLLLITERNADLIAAGQYWRVFTALFFQDGGLWGGISNIFFLGLVGTIAEQQLSRWQWLAIYFGTGLCAELVALMLQPVGAGNSIALFGLAASLSLQSFRIRTNKWFTALGVLSGITAAALLLYKDIHGVAFMIGIALSLTFVNKKSWVTVK